MQKVYGMQYEQEICFPADEFLCSSAKFGQLAGSFCLLRRSCFIYPSDSNLLQQGTTSAFKKMLTADRQVGLPEKGES
jgi:hypothetical protein